MKKKSFIFASLSAVFLIVFLIISCATDDEGSARIIVQNNSDYDITELKVLWTWPVDGYPAPRDLKKGEQYVVDAALSSGDSGGGVIIEYIMNGQQFTCYDAIGGITYPRGTHYSSREIKDGSRLNISVTNDGYELSGGVPSSRP